MLLCPFGSERQFDGDLTGDDARELGTERGYRGRPHKARAHALLEGWIPRCTPHLRSVPVCASNLRMPRSTVSAWKAPVASNPTHLPQE